MKFIVKHHHPVLLFAILLLLTLAPTVAHGQTTVYAEAIGSANVRSGPGVSFEQIGAIKAGSRYPILGRSSRVPWVFINFGDGTGWVFNDLIKVYGSIDTVPFITESTEGKLGPVQTTVPTATTAPDASANPPAMPRPSLTPSYTPSPQPTTPTNVYAEAQGETNVRYGPGTDFPRIGTLTNGARYAVLRRHTRFDWIEIAFDQVAGKRGWVIRAAVKIIGNLNSVPTTSSTDFGYPTLTATPNQVVTAAAPWTTAQGSGTPTGPDLVRLGNRLFDYLLRGNFAPNTNRQASAFLMDLKSGSAVSLAPGTAYSGMSLIKIPILVSVFRKLDNPPNNDIAVELGQMMICSNNDATNAMLALGGDGDMVAGTKYVTDTVQQLGLKDTFITSPIRSDPRATLVPASTLKTTVDQKATDPDPFNQSTPANLGYLLSSVYQCSKDGSGPLTATFGKEFTATECRQMMRLLSSDKIGVMIEAGVPATALVAHKHGWIDQTLGDAGIVYSPGGDFVLVVMMSDRPVLQWPQEFPRVSEIARMVWNEYNPGQLVTKIDQKVIPETCTLPDALLADIRALDLPSFP